MVTWSAERTQTQSLHYSKPWGFSLEVASIIFTLGRSDGYYVAYKPITLSCILFMFTEMKFIHCYSCVKFAMKSMSRCND